MVKAPWSASHSKNRLVQSMIHLLLGEVAREQALSCSWFELWQLLVNICVVSHVKSSQRISWCLRVCQILHTQNGGEPTPYYASRLKYPLGSCKEACTTLTEPTFSLLLTWLLSHFISFFFWIPAKWIHSKRETCGSVKSEEPLQQSLK